MFKKLSFAIVVIVFAANNAVAQKLRIDVQGVAQPTPVAIVPFGWEGNSHAMPLDIAEVIDRKSVV